MLCIDLDWNWACGSGQFSTCRDRRAIVRSEASSGKEVLTLPEKNIALHIKQT